MEQSSAFCLLPPYPAIFLRVFSVNFNQICVSPTCQTLFAMYFLAQKRLSFSDRILRHSVSGKYGGCLDCSLFNPKFSPLDASFFALNGSRARISWKKMAYRSVQSMLDHIHFFLLQDLDNTSTLIGLNGVRKRKEENLQRAIIFTAHFSTDQCIRKKHVFREFVPRKYTVHTNELKMY